MSEPRMFRDKSIASLSGSSQQACAPNGNRQFLLIENTGTANVGVNFSGPNSGGSQTTTGIGNVAAIAGAGTVTVVANGSLIFEGLAVPQNAVNIIGTAGQPVVVIEA